MRKITFNLAALSCAAFTLLTGTNAGAAGAVRAGFDASSLAPNDDGSTGFEATGITMDFFGTIYTGFYINNNGNVTFDSPLSTFTPFDLLSTATPIIAPFFADVDTGGAGSDIVKYGAGTVGAYSAFGVNWVDVGYYDERDDKLNSFQLVVIDRSDTGAGNFDFEFNYDTINWETGEASDGTDGLGGFSARAGWSNGSSADYELTGSAVNGAFLDAGVNALISDSLDSDGVDGRYVFRVRTGVIEPPRPTPTVPDGGATVGFLMAGLLGIGLMRRTSKQ